MRINEQKQIEREKMDKKDLEKEFSSAEAILQGLQLDLVRKEIWLREQVLKNNEENTGPQEHKFLPFHFSDSESIAKYEAQINELTRAGWWLCALSWDDGKAIGGIAW